MDRKEVIRVALRTLGRNKLRTALTLLGITIGISAVICTVAIGQGGQTAIQEQMLMLGDNFVWIEAGGRNVNGVRTGTGNTKTLTLADMNAMLQQIPLLKACSPQADARTQIVYENQNWNTSYRGVSPDFITIRRWTMAEGGVFTQDDVDSAATVAVIGQTVKTILFGAQDPLGRTMRVGNIPFRVIGVLQPKGFSATGQDQDDFIVIPYTTAMHKVKGIDWLDDILCSANSQDAMTPSLDLATMLLRERHHIMPGQPDDFNIRSPEEILKARADANRTFTLMLASIASVSLLVGGIGIMNIMLVSVTERTREIGVRMAVGASEQDVQSQFLMEAVVLSLLGGAIGVPGGMLASFAISTILGWQTDISFLAIGVAVLFSVFTGVFFGYYPAQKAAQLDPIEALRYE
jgi:putative ABC transport system permease protein